MAFLPMWRELESSCQHLEEGAAYLKIQQCLKMLLVNHRGSQSPGGTFCEEAAAFHNKGHGGQVGMLTGSELWQFLESTYTPYISSPGGAGASWQKIESDLQEDSVLLTEDISKTARGNPGQ